MSIQIQIKRIMCICTIHKHMHNHINRYPWWVARVNIFQQNYWPKFIKQSRLLVCRSVIDTTTTTGGKQLQRAILSRLVWQLWMRTACQNWDFCNRITTLILFSSRFLSSICLDTFRDLACFISRNIISHSCAMNLYTNFPHIIKSGKLNMSHSSALYFYLEIPCFSNRSHPKYPAHHFCSCKWI